MYLAKTATRLNFQRSDMPVSLFSRHNGNGTQACNLSYNFILSSQYLNSSKIKTSLESATKYTKINLIETNKVGYCCVFRPANSCLCMPENNENHWKIMKKVTFLSCVQEAHVRPMNENEEKSYPK